jgi:methylenetetrahydrofolate reductase (NADPH)
MHIQDIFEQHRTTFSFEFFPPGDSEASEKLFTTITELEALKPSFVSVTYGAGGAKRRLTQDLVARIKTETSCDPIPHLPTVCHAEPEVRDILERYAELGISNILGLAGDPPRSMKGFDRSQDAFRYAADLVKYIKCFNEQGAHPDKRGFGIGVAGFPEGHPETPNRLSEMEYLKAKVEAGADYIVTQLFFDNRDFFDFRERCELAGIKVPILAGIMPVTSARGMVRMADLALGVRFPASLLRAVRRCDGDEKYIRKVGVQWATEQCRSLLDNHVRGIHFYTLNRSTATREIYSFLGGGDSRRLDRD